MAPASVRLLLTTCLTLLLTLPHLAWAQAEGDADVQLAPLPSEAKATDDERVVEEEEADGADEEVVQVPASVPDSPKLFFRSDLDSHFSFGRLAEAKAAYDRRRYARAYKLLAGAGDGLPVRYLRALSLLGARRYAEAAKALEPLCTEYQPLQDHCAMQAAFAYERLGKRAKALELYAKVRVPAQAYVAARLEMAKLLKKKGDHRVAMEALEPITLHPVRPVRAKQQADALMAYADLARAAGAYNSEHKALLAVWSAFPKLPQAEAAKKRLERLPILPKARVARAESLLALHFNDEAMEQAQGVLKGRTLPEALACRAQFTVGKALRKERRHQKAIAALVPVVTQCTDAGLRARALFVLGYSESVVAVREALTTYDALARDYPTDELADSALLFAGEMASRLGDAQAALSRFERVVATYPHEPSAAEALFKAFWIRRTQGDKEGALRLLAKTQALPPGAVTLEQEQRARYWKARTLETLGHLEGARGELEVVVREGATTYYGLLARARLEIEDPVRANRLLADLQTYVPDEKWPLKAGPLVAHPRFETGVELIRLGLPGAHRELLAIDCERMPDESAALVFQVLQATGHDAAARLLASRLLRSTGAGLARLEARHAWKSAFPPRFRDVISENSEKAKVDPDLVQALVREESAFNPRARSSTGALGLTQLMPQTARAVARTLNMTPMHNASLMNPKRNVRLGAAYLGELIQRFSGQAVYAVAAYNAGPNAVERWQRMFPQASMDEWVEQIPVDETRGYVKRVLGSYGTYSLLYGEAVGDAARAQVRAALAENRP